MARDYYVDDCCNVPKKPKFKLVEFLLTTMKKGKKVAVKSMDEVVNEINNNDCCDGCFCGRHFMKDEVTGEKMEITIQSGVVVVKYPDTGEGGGEQ